MKIKRLSGHEILDSRGNPALSIDIELQNGICETVSIPSGASKGSFEALELRDLDLARYNGLGLRKAISNVESIFEGIKDIDVEDQREIDLRMIEMDGTPNKEKLGANAMLGVSYAALKASSKTQKKEYFYNINELFNHYFHKDIKINIPTPLFNILNGGAHADNGLDFQEFILIPVNSTNNVKSLESNCDNKSNYEETQASIQMVSEILHSLKKILKKMNYSTGVGDEGGFAPFIKDPKEALNLISEATIMAGYLLSIDISFGIDCASNYFFNTEKNKYTFHTNLNGKTISNNLDYADMEGYYETLLENYPLIYLEDFFSEEDWDSFSKFLSKNTSRNVLFTGDDLTVTNISRLDTAINKQSINSMIIKPNQIGTVYETFRTVNKCIENNIVYVVSHRSGETNDSIITDMSVGLGSKFLKAGAPQRGERVAKYNRLLEIARLTNNAK